MLKKENDIKTKIIRILEKEKTNKDVKEKKKKRTSCLRIEFESATGWRIRMKVN